MFGTVRSTAAPRGRNANANSTTENFQAKQAGTSHRQNATNDSQRRALGVIPANTVGGRTTRSKAATKERKRNREHGHSKTSHAKKQTTIPRQASKVSVARPRQARQQAREAATSSSTSMADDSLLGEMVDDAHVTEIPHENIDADDFGNAQFVAEYVTDIYKYLSHLEDKQKVDSKYMCRQLDIQEKMRTVLVSWLIEVAIEFQLMSETLFLSIAILDQYLQQRQVSREKLQLVGMSAMFIASKYEEIWHSPVEDFVYICANTYDRDEVLQMECTMLQTLDFDVSYVTPLQFLRRFSKAARSDARLHTCCKYFIELSLPVYGMLSFKPSMIAASAVYLSRKLAGRKPIWTDTLHYYTGYSEEQLTPCVRTLIIALRRECRATELSPVSEKYSQQDFFKVSTTVLDYYRRREQQRKANKQ